MASRKVLLILFAVLVIAFVGGIGKAEAVVETGQGGNLLADIKPLDAKPGERVAITLTAYGFDLANSYIRWFKDDREVLSGYGDKTFSLQLGALGSKTKVAVYVAVNGKYVATKTFIFEPASLGLAWQAETFVPPFYQGKPRATAGADLKIIATPYLIDQQGKIESTNQLNFVWQKDGVALSASSGIGKNVLAITTESTARQVKVNLTVTSQTEGKQASQELIINLEQPIIAFYEQEPLAGVNYNQQIGTTYELYKEEVGFQAVPFFWPINRLNQLVYGWQVNNLPVKNQSSRPDMLIVRQAENGAGQSIIGLKLDSGDIRALVSKNFNIQFGNNLLKFNNGN